MKGDYKRYLVYMVRQERATLSLKELNTWPALGTFYVLYAHKAAFQRRILLEGTVHQLMPTNLEFRSRHSGLLRDFIAEHE